jgi:hypothetical protein
MGLLGNAGINAPLYVYVARWFDRRRGTCLGADRKRTSQATSQERRVSIVPATAAWLPTAVVITYDTRVRTKRWARLILLPRSQSKRRANAGFGPGDHPMKNCFRRLD